MNAVSHSDDKNKSLKETGERGLAGVVEGHLRRYIRADDVVMPSSGLYHQIMREVERPLLRLVMELTDGNQIRAAEILGLNRNTLHKKLAEHDILPESAAAKRRRIRKMGRADG